MGIVNRNSRSKRIIAAVLALTLAASCIFGLCACNDTPSGPKKAIIYVTALFSGGIYDSSSNTPVWDPVDFDVDVVDFYKGELEISDIVSSLDSTEFMKILDLVEKVMGVEKEGNLLYDLALDMDGNLKNPAVIPANGYPVDKNGEVMDISYGVLGIYEEFVENLKERYGQDYDVLVYNQDWRKSSARSAADLEKFINSKGYTDVIFMSHSMGSAVVNSYLSRSAQNREKCKLYMGFAPATLGSFEALAVLTNPGTYIKTMMSGMLSPDSGLPLTEDTVNDFVTNLMSTENGDFVFNNEGLITLVPSWQYLSSDQYGEGEYGITVDGKPITGEEELYEFYESLPWAHYLVENEENPEIRERVLAAEGQQANKDGYRIKSVVATLEDYFASLFVDGKLACESVNSYYFLGTNCSTVVGLDFTSYEDENGNLAYDYSVRYGRGGDGVVPTYSSIGGANIEELDASGRIIRFERGAHVIVGADYDLIAPDMFRLIDEAVGYNG